MSDDVREEFKVLCQVTSVRNLRFHVRWRPWGI